MMVEDNREDSEDEELRAYCDGEWGDDELTLLRVQLEIVVVGMVVVVVGMVAW